MITPMFLVPGREEGPSIDQIKLTWYMDGQYVARLIIDGSSFGGSAYSFCPRMSHVGSGQQNTYAIETENLTYPIAGFDGWIGPDNQPYQNVTVPGSYLWQPRSLPDYPLFGSKGVWAMDRHNSPTREAQSSFIAISKSDGQELLIPEFMVSPPNNLARIQNEPFPETILKESIPYVDINPSARWIAMTVEIS